MIKLHYIVRIAFATVDTRSTVFGYQYLFDLAASFSNRPSEVSSALGRIFSSVSVSVFHSVSGCAVLLRTTRVSCIPA